MLGSASNIVASSLDPYDVMIMKYKDAKSNLENLKELGAFLLHGVDATKMKLHVDLKMWRFDRIVFNFPHAGFHGKEDDARLIKMHRNLMQGFFRNASGMLRADGEIHVNHKTTPPFCHWNLEELAYQTSLVLTECVVFKKEDYPGYKNKRGDGSRCDEPFPLGECSTFKFRLYPCLKKMAGASTSRTITHRSVQQSQLIPIQMQQHIPTPFCYPQEDVFAPNFEGRVVTLSEPGIIRNECSRIFSWYFSHVLRTFGQPENDMGHFVREGLRFGFAKFMAEAPGRPTSDYIVLMEELHRASVLRWTWLSSMLDNWS